MDNKYPQISVKLSGEDGNAFAILARRARAARKAGLDRDEIDAFRKEATSGDYDHLIQTALGWFRCR
ncbi:hypothetical protein [Pseudooceanicola nitratireducens]|uniref:hypothetical protein n=1 Tax=Pseudooceanicola nitratireducens TaxID=517719 RepID=UPI003C7CEE3F